ncbi:MAG TPA: ParB/RepB/Spo0J family partition protein [Acidimicrobiales bacterium]|nr:ParB/RepB/Spo0J family partition protein [Acidimicrobiales bacterium]
MARPSGLGKGLGALIPTAELADVGSTDLQDLPVGVVDPNPNQPRTYFDEEALVSLTASVAAVGVLQPVLVRPAEGGRFELIAGERRWRAAKRAGLQTIPALVRTVADADSLEQALVENLHREDLNPLEEAAAYQQLMEDFGLTQEQVANRVGKSRSAVTNTLRLFQLPPSVQKLVAERKLSAGHARALLGSPDRLFQETTARRAVAEELSVREVEELVRQHVDADQEPTEEPASRPAASLRPAGLVELEELLSAHLDTRVSVTMGAKRGRVVVDFATIEDLERIYRAMTSGRETDG